MHIFHIVFIINLKPSIKNRIVNLWIYQIEDGYVMIYPGHGIPFEYSALKDNLSYVNKLELYPLKPIK